MARADATSPEIGQRIKTGREALGLSVAELAAALDLKAFALRELEAGRSVIQWSKLTKIAEALRTTPNLILGWETDGANREPPEKSTTCASAGARFKAARMAKGLTLDAIAKSLGTSNQNLSRIQNGDVRMSVEWAERLAPLLGLTVHELLLGSEKARNEPNPTSQPHERLAEARRNMKLTMEQLAALAGTTNQQIYKLEHGHRALSQKWAEKLSPHLGMTAMELMFGAAASEAAAAGQESNDENSGQSAGVGFKALLGDDTDQAEEVRRLRDENEKLKAAIRALMGD